MTRFAHAAFDSPYYGYAPQAWNPHTLGVPSPHPMVQAAPAVSHVWAGSAIAGAVAKAPMARHAISATTAALPAATMAGVAVSAPLGSSSRMAPAALPVPRRPSTPAHGPRPAAVTPSLSHTERTVHWTSFLQENRPAAGLICVTTKGGGGPLRSRGGDIAAKVDGQDFVVRTVRNENPTPALRSLREQIYNAGYALYAEKRPQREPGAKYVLGVMSYPEGFRNPQAAQAGSIVRLSGLHQERTLQLPSPIWVSLSNRQTVPVSRLTVGYHPPGARPRGHRRRERLANGPQHVAGQLQVRTWLDRAGRMHVKAKLIDVKRNSRAMFGLR